MRKGTLIISGIFLIGLIYLYYLVTQIPPNILDTETGPEFVPKIYIIAGLIVTVILLIQTLRDKNQIVSQSEEPDENKLNINLVYYVGLLVLYLISISFVGFYISTFIVIFILLFIKKVKNVALLILVPVVFNLFIFVLFDSVIGLPIP